MTFAFNECLSFFGHQWGCDAISRWADDNINLIGWLNFGLCGRTVTWKTTGGWHTNLTHILQEPEGSLHLLKWRCWEASSL